MSTSIETTNGTGYGSTVNSRITFEDFVSTIVDKRYEESALISTFDSILDKIELEGKLQEYEETLKANKKDTQNKITMWKLVSSPYGILLDKWNDEFKAKFAKTSFKPETVEYMDKVRDTKAPSGFKEVTKVRFINNLKDANENNLSTIISFMIEHFDLTEEIKTDFESILKDMDSIKNESAEFKLDKANKYLANHSIKATSESFGIASEFIKNRLAERTLQINSIIKKHEMSVNFISWKLKRIGIRKNTSKINKLNSEAIDMNSKIMEKSKKNANFASLMNIANKWNL